MGTETTSLDLSASSEAPRCLSLGQLRILEDVGLHYNLPEPAIICTHCRYALQVDDISRHLRKNHDVLKSTRRHLNSLIRSLHLPNPDLLPARADGSTPHPHLALQVGAACKYCDLRSTSLEVLSRHLKKAHECEIRRAGSKRKYWLRDHIEERLTFQSWTAKDILRSWIVSTSDRQPERGSVNSGLLPQETSDPVKNFAQQLFTEERERLEKQSGVRRPFDGSAPTPSLMTNWMRRAGWHDLFSGACRKILVTLSEMPWTTGRPVWLGVYDGEVLHSPVGDERRLALIMAALDRLFDRCGETVRCTDVCVRRWLRGKFPDRPYKAPFELVIRPASERAYRKELKRCLCLWLRLLQLPPSTARSIMGRRLSRSQRNALKQLWSDPIWQEERSIDPDDTDQSYEKDSAEEYENEDEDSDEEEEEDNEEYSEDDDGSDAESFTVWSSNSQEIGPDDPAADVVLQFCYHMVTEDFEDGRSSSTMLVYFSAVRGLSTPSGDEYLRPHRFTPILSRLIYCARLIFLEALLPRFPHKYVGIASRPRYGQLKTLNAVRRERMCDGTLSPMGEFLSLLAYGNALQRCEGPVYHFHWSEDGDVLSWDGHSRLSMDSFRGLAREVLRSATLRCKRLMYDWEPADINLNNIRDKISTTTPGYSFVSDPANGLADAYLDLFLRACASPTDGLLKKHGQDQSTWDAKAAQAYLDGHDEFLKMLMVLFNLDGGQAARISELLTIEHCNTSSRLRGICIYGAKMFSITRHHKTRLSTNNEFQVARFFSKPVTMLAYRYLVYIRPVAYTILRKCFLHASEDTLLFAPASRSGSWTTKTFTEELRQFSKAVPGISFGIGVQLYRQLSIAITEKHVHRVAINFNRFDDVTNAAEEDVAFAWQSGHRPMQRYSTYGLDGAFPDQLQPALLRIYAKVSAEWHAFLRIEDQESSQVSDGAKTVHATNRNTKEGSPLRKRPRECIAETSAASSESHENRKRQRIASPDVSSPELGSADFGAGGDDTITGRVDEYQITIGSPSFPSIQEEASDSIKDCPFLTIGPFVHMPQFNLVVCRHCKHAVLAKEVQSHLHHNPSHRRNFTRKQRHDMGSQILNLPGILKDQDDLRNFQPPSADTTVVPFIEPPREDGFACQQCPYVARQLHNIQRHCREEHGWVNSRKRGRCTKVSAGQEYRYYTPWRTGVRCQRFFYSRMASGWFQVCRTIKTGTEPGENAGQVHEADK